MARARFLLTLPLLVAAGWGCTLVAGLEDHELAGAGADAGDTLPAGCDGTKSPQTEPCLIDDRVGFFVSPTGNDANAGTKAAPFLTIAKALEQAQVTRHRVFLCGPRFEESIELVRGGTDLVSAIYGGFACDGWRYTGEKVTIAPREPGYALRVDGLTGSLVIEDLELRAQDAVLPPPDPRASSIAAFVSTSAEVVMRRTRLVAGVPRGAPPPASLANPPLDPNTAGNPAMGLNPAPLKTCACAKHGSSSGGFGGNPTTLGTGHKGGTGVSVPAAVPADPSRAGVGGGQSGNVGCTPLAQVGAGGQARDGGVAASTLGAVTLSGWVPSVGLPGLAGNPGQGGGGGGYANNSGGVGGGCGGCGGGGGNGGAAGGASVGLLVLKTEMKLIDCKIDVVAGADGATGGPGENGRVGGAGGSTSSGTCAGATGGPGAGGSGGAGGAGGLSIGVYFEDPAPSWNGVPLAADSLAVDGVTIGAAGKPGRGGQGGLAATQTDGVPGAPGSDGLPGIAKAALRR